MSSYNLPPNAPMDTRYEGFLRSIKLWNVYGQFGEEAIVNAIFARIGTANKWCFECGAADGLFFSNTRLLIDQGWEALLVECDSGDFKKLHDRFDASEKVRILQKYLVAQAQSEQEITIDDALTLAGAPDEIDLVIIDIDSQDYYIFNSLIRHRPRVVIVEFDPEAEPMFIPEHRGGGQAGHLAMRYVANARGYEVITRTQCNLICVRRDLAPKLEAKPAEAPKLEVVPKSDQPRKAIEGPKPGERFEIYAAGRWQEYSDDADVHVLPEEMEDAKAGKLPVRKLVSDGMRPVRVALAMSLPRQGYLDAYDSIIQATAQAGARFLGWGVSWSHSLTRSIERILTLTDDNPEPWDFIMTADYDTFATAKEMESLARLLARNPDVDVIVPLQCKRAVDEILVGHDSGVNLTLDLVPITVGHFGFTMFRADCFAKLSKPWLIETPDPQGGWNEGRKDWDMYFWENAKNSGLKVMLAPGVVVGHGEEYVSYPRVVNGKVTKVLQSTNDWQLKRKMPEGIGVINEVMPHAAD